MRKRKLFYIIFISLLVAASIVGAAAYYMLYMPNFKPAETGYVYIYEDNKDFDALCDDLQAAGCRDIRFFKWLA
ncbi:MAG: aminodeoxychorismate lyase, partial [Tannerella sp.]|nr:aminodeoxychorismate lyase [Tannerella sp.]